MAAGSYSASVASTPVQLPVAVPITNGSPAAAVALLAPGGGQLPSDTEIAGISCLDPSDCSVVGTSGSELSLFPAAVVGAEVGGTWRPLDALSVPALTTLTVAYAVGTGISCVATQSCTATGALVVAGTVSAFTAASAPPLSVTTASLPAAQVGKRYSATLRSSGGIGGDSWSVVAGALPAGLRLNPTTGVISGTPTANGQSGFVVGDVQTGPPSQSACVSLSISVAAASTLRAPYVRTAGTRATVVLTCMGAPCAGSYVVTAVERLKHKKVTAVVALGGRHKHRITLAGGRYSLRAGQSRAVVVKLSRKARGLLAR